MLHLCGELEPMRRRNPARSLDCPALGLPSASAVGSGGGVGEEGAAELKASAKAVKILPDGARVGGDKACTNNTTHTRGARVRRQEEGGGGEEGGGVRCLGLVG